MLWFVSGRQLLRLICSFHSPLWGRYPVQQLHSFSQCSSSSHFITTISILCFCDVICGCSLQGTTTTQLRVTGFEVGLDDCGRSRPAGMAPRRILEARVATCLSCRVLRRVVRRAARRIFLQMAPRISL